MKSTALTIKVFGTYFAVTGLGLLLIPNLWPGAAWTKMALASESPP